MLVSLQKTSLALTTCCSIFALVACEPAPQGVKSQTARPWVHTLVYAQAMYANPIYDRDVTSFLSFFTTRYGIPKTTFKFGYTDLSLTRPYNGNTKQAIQALADETRNGDDLAVVMLATKGAPNALAVKPFGGQAYYLSAEALAGLLEPLEDDLHLVIVQACYSGSLIDDLARPNRIILTATKPDRSSLGCQTNAQNTWYIQALNRALQGGGSLEEIAARTRGILAQHEAALEIPARDRAAPQIYVGTNMLDIWQN